MFVIPSIDILNGKCVQLVNGRINSAKIYGEPKYWLDKWVRKGADIIHLIDLDGALGIGSNKDIILDLLKEKNIKFQVGGGIRNIDYAVELIQNNAERIIIGSKAIDENFLEKLNKRIPKEKIMIALDVKDGFVVTNGWKEKSGLKIEDLTLKIKSKAGSILSTDVSSEGLLNGPNVESLKSIQQKNMTIYVSGGFTTIEDIKLAEKLGFSGVIIGQALYKEKLNFEELW